MIGLIVVIALVGFLVWAITTAIPMPPLFKTAIYVIVAICLLFYLMNLLGVHDVPLPHVR